MQLARELLRRTGHLALVCTALLSEAAGARCQVQSFDIPVTMNGGRAVAHVPINGTAPAFTLDSGAFFSSLTEAAAAQLNLKTRSTRAEVWGLTGRIDYR